MRGMLGFQEDCGTEESCIDALDRLRWPQGYVCARCGVRPRGLRPAHPVEPHLANSCDVSTGCLPEVRLGRVLWRPVGLRI